MYYINNEISTEVRFDTMKFLNFNGDNIDPLDSFMLANLKRLPVEGSFKISKEAYRPDLISYKIYDDTQYWWLLMFYNDVIDINQLTPGTDLLYPNKAYFETLYQNASLLEKTT